MSDQDPIHAFGGYGVELEYMIVDTETHAVRPVADELLKQVGGGYDQEVELDQVAWSNELALHVIEIKTNGPSPTLEGLGNLFQGQIPELTRLLEPLGARLMPTGMHPLMNPDDELRLWPHENNVIYNTFDRIFDCRGHGWANLQSTHINLPFANDQEFGRLHAAIRLILPLLPSLAASSPIMDGKPTDSLDTRLDAYRHNADRVFSVMGHVIPERVFTQRDYEQQLLGRIYKDLAPHDPEGVLRHEWVNARGCIARFDRMAIEIRLLDIQECPQADLAVAGAVVEVVRALFEEAWASTHEQQKWDEQELAVFLAHSIRDGEETVLENRHYLAAFGWPDRGRARAGELWQHLIETVVARHPNYGEWSTALEVIVRDGTLARRILHATGPAPTAVDIIRVYRGLSDCLEKGELFRCSR